MKFLGHPHHDGSALYVSKNQVWVRVPAALHGDGASPREGQAAPLGATRPVFDQAPAIRYVMDGEPRFAPMSVDASRSGRPVGGYGATDVWWTGVIPASNP